jgi:phosphoribosylformimino-5-aminoimidazole carboxamide ribotide isomerase
MRIIPVIDLLDGVVVHAKKGLRQHYQPIQSQLCNSSAPLEVVSALLALYPFTQLYIADLNAIQKSGGAYNANYSIIEAIRQRYPALELWLDVGISNNTELAIWQKLNVRLVIGSENFASISHYCALGLEDKPFVLSLDFFAQGYQGPAELLANTAYWPQDVIVMSLANVGTNQGGNEALMGEILLRATDKDNSKNLYAAGGIRSLDDLLQLKNLGISGALIATALHQRQISNKEIGLLTN